MSLTDLTSRQKLILALVIRQYVETVQPVGSKILVQAYGLDFSPATVRNEMARLTDYGYLGQPHTSAGRVPTEAGYRYFVGELLGHTELPPDTRRTISHQFYQAGRELDDWMRLAASVLARQSQGASLVTAPHTEKARFKHLELIATRGRQALMVLVLVGGDVRQQMLVLAEPVSQERLRGVADVLNKLYAGLDAESIAAYTSQLDDLGQDLTRLTLDEMRRSHAMVSGEVYRDGLTNVLAEPEFAESEIARNALRLLEERPLLEDLLSRTVKHADVGGVQVLIGGEGIWEELRECTVVLARYGAPGRATGMLGVLGPIRMSYGRTISTVRYVARMLSELVIEMIVE
jgi:heat-inducible transcriptional repressor